jgi:hypothetical protein
MQDMNGKAMFAALQEKREEDPREEDAILLTWVYL